MPGKTLKALFIALPLTVFITALCICLPSKNSALVTFIDFSYSLFFILLCLWSVSAALLIKAQGVLKLLKENWIGILSALCLTALCLFFIDAWFRLLSDETNLIAVSQSMAFQKKVFLAKMARLVNGELLPLVYTTPKRPLLFSFVLSLVHNVFGYRFENAFMLNLGVLFALLGLVFMAVKKMAGSTVAVAAQVLIIAQPVIPLHATSAGFDLFSAFFFWLSLFAVYLFMQKKDARSFAFLWTTLVMFANVRYESFFLMILIISFLAATRYIDREVLKKNAFVLAMTPLLFLPRILQTWISTRGLVENPEGVPSFSLHHFAGNVRILGSSLFDFKRLLPYATILNLISLVLLAVIAAALLRRKTPRLNRRQKHFIFLSLSCIVCLLIIFLPYYMGSCAHPSTVRFFIIPVIFLSLVPPLFCTLYPGKTSTIAVCALALFSLAFYFPVTRDNRLLSNQFAVHHLQQAYRFLNNQTTQKALVISATPSQFIPLGYSAVDFETANANISGIAGDLKTRAYEAIFVFQTVSPETGRVLPGNRLHPLFKLKAVNRFSSLDGNEVRISKADIDR